MTGRLGPGSWAVQQLAGFLASVAAPGDVRSAFATAAHRLAEALEADVCAIVSDGELVTTLGFPAEDVPQAELLAVAGGRELDVEVPGVGTVPLIGVDVRSDGAPVVVLGRHAEPFGPGERHLVRAMVQVLTLTLQLRWTAARERDLRRAVEEQAEELRDVNEQLSDALRVKRDLVSMASHELRTPLVAMLGFTTLLRDGWEEFSDDSRAQYLAILDRHGRRMLRLVDDLLTVGRLEDDRIVTHRVETSLSEAVAVVLRDLGRDDVELSLDPDHDDRVLIDVDHLAQVIANLVDNAHKYGAPPIRVEVVTTPDWCGVEVVDHGDGVPPEFVPVLFDRFTQASTGLHRAGTGVGLGLAIVAGLVGRNEGWVAYERADGRTRFSVRFRRPRGQDGRV